MPRDRFVLIYILSKCQNEVYGGDLDSEHYYDEMAERELEYPYDPDFDSERYYEHEEKLHIDDDYREIWRQNLERREELNTRHRTLARETSVANLDIPTILNALSSTETVDGVLPPLLRTELWRQMYVKTVQRLCQGQADAIIPEDEVEPGVVCAFHKDHSPMTILRCDRAIPVPEVCAGFDFQLSGIAPFTPAWPTVVQGR
ncbi:hypothetical protein IFM51744_04534 [Aspergillus udagawae]|nr:hypothetical protein IFM51744_04534 [Aspergillus udagawae]GFF76809.1 hypothetical protein IFM62136_09412 [Aspergillus lentulus]